MIIDDFNIIGVAVFKIKTQTPFLIDTDTPLISSVTGQFFQAIARRITQIVDSASRMQHFQFAQCQKLEGIRPLAGLFAYKNGGSMFAAERLNHAGNNITRHVKLQVAYQAAGSLEN